MANKDSKTSGDITQRDITPDTRVGKLLEAFPQLEETLIAMSPSFAKLRNPVLRQTVAKVATLRQVAQIGNLPVGELINHLRDAAGLQPIAVADEKAKGTDARPGWVTSNAVSKSFDARPVIESGGHPLNQVLEDLKNMRKGQVYELITPFLPAPLIDVVKGKGFRVWSEQVETSVIKTFISLP
jgi:uncharacterized protein (DUF2249 family)